MQGRESNKALSVASLATLAAALALSVPVVERLSAAIWQWYKFAGYSNDGHITLRLKTGLLFSGLLAVTFGFALWFNQLAKRRAASRARSWSFLAMCIAAAVLAVYWLLGMSRSQCLAGLTIHSSRTRFAGRLNSGVRPHVHSCGFNRAIHHLGLGIRVLCVPRWSLVCVGLSASAGLGSSQRSFHYRHRRTDPAWLSLLLPP